jgi:hypothetical protein
MSSGLDGYVVLLASLAPSLEQLLNGSNCGICLSSSAFGHPSALNVEQEYNTTVRSRFSFTLSLSLSLSLSLNKQAQLIFLFQAEVSLWMFGSFCLS